MGTLKSHSSPPRAFDYIVTEQPPPPPPPPPTILKVKTSQVFTRLKVWGEDPEYQTNMSEVVIKNVRAFESVFGDLQRVTLMVHSLP